MGNGGMRERGIIKMGKFLKEKMLKRESLKWGIFKTGGL